MYEQKRRRFATPGVVADVPHQHAEAATPEEE
jgi:hypothetical protein